jgi:osmoprotectant transport system ATP-binding protein
VAKQTAAMISETSRPAKPPARAGAPGSVSELMPSRAGARRPGIGTALLSEVRRRTAPVRTAAWATGAELVFDRATKVYDGGAPAVDQLSLSVPAGEICALVGPSGCGKTTALRLVNRLIDLTSGDILIDGRSVRSFDATELRRSIGYVIEGNIGTVPRLYGRDRKWIRVRALELLELVGLDPTYAKRYPSQLSGGERQRVGLARAIAANPPLMLLDEPFGALDPIVRSRLQDEFRRLQQEVKKTVLFVTHDIDEAIKVGDRIAILRSGGRLAQYDTPETILKSPADDFVADFVGRDRALKALELHTLAELELRPAMDGIRLPATTPLREALSTLIADHATVIAVTGADGTVLGSLTRDDLLQ